MWISENFHALGNLPDSIINRYTLADDYPITVEVRDCGRVRVKPRYGSFVEGSSDIGGLDRLRGDAHEWAVRVMKALADHPGLF